MKPLSILFASVGLALLSQTGAASTATTQPAAPSSACPPSARVLANEELKRLRAQAKDHGAMWQLQRDGKTSYLFGTLHIGKAQWFAPGPQLRHALAQSHRLIVELDPFAPPEPAQALRGADQKPLSVRVSPHWQASIDRLAQEACIPQQALGRMNVFSRLRTLSYAVGQRDGLHRVYSQERMLVNQARSQHWPVVTLETHASQALALRPVDGASAKRMIDTTLAQLEDGTLRRVTQRMAAAWETGNLDDLAAYESWCECVKNDHDRELLARANGARNQLFAQRLSDEHRQGASFLAAVGALHMTGPQALPTLLEGLGFKVTRIRYAP